MSYTTTGQRQAQQAYQHVRSPLTATSKQRSVSCKHKTAFTHFHHLESETVTDKLAAFRFNLRFQPR